jgi:uncharacterized membrane protein YhaH (DUF805 family)
MKWLYFFGNLDGRISRRTFWLAMIVVFVVAVLLATIADMIGSELVNVSAGDLMGDVVLLVFVYPQFVIAVKRGHDRNIATWVIGACYAVIAIADGLDLFGLLKTRVNQNVFSSAGIISFAVMFVVGIIALALLIELGLRRGTQGANRYGPDPLANT